MESLSHGCSGQADGPRPRVQLWAFFLVLEEKSESKLGLILVGVCI